MKRDERRVKAINLLNAYGDEVKVISRSAQDRGMGSKRTIISFDAPAGYLKPKRIVYFSDMKPVFTDSFIMMNPWKVEAPGIDGLTGACKRNLKEASQAVHLGGVDLARSIDWEIPFDLRQDRGWFPIRKQPGFKINPQKFLNSLLNTGSMIEVPGTLHHPPLALKGKQPNKGFNLVKSFKTTHRIPVLQVTLWKLRDKWLAELDIDLTSGVRHWKEVVRNHLTGGKTNPYLVNQLLAWYWGIVSFKLELSADKSG